VTILTAITVDGEALDRQLTLAFLLGYSSGMPLAKRKISVSLDEDLVVELEAIDRSLSAQINAAVRTHLEHQRRQRRLTELLDRLDAEHGVVEEALVEKYVRLLE